MPEEKKHDAAKKTAGLYADFAAVFAKIGAVAYGGGPSMVPVLKAEVVERKGWLQTESFMDILALANALPGPLVTKMAVAIGYVRGGLMGGLVSVLAMVLPSAAALLVLLGFVELVRDNPMVGSMLAGIRPVVVSMLAYAAWDMAPNALKDKATLAIGLAALLLLVFSPLHPALIIIAGALAGLAMKL